MAHARIFLGLVVIAGILFMESCSSGKSSYEHGNYYQAVMTSVNKLRRNTDHKKSVETLRQAYPLAVKYFEDQANNAIASSAEFKWSAVVQSYASINSMYDEIKRSPGALTVIPNPVNYYGKLEEAKRNAAEENYQAGIQALMTGNREKAKQAYRYFKTANEFVTGYKDVVKMMEKALWDATVKVLVTPIPTTKNVAWSAQFFDDKISEFLHGTPINEFVKFYTASEAQTLKLNPDHIVQLEFDEFTVGQVTLHEKQIQLEKDSVVVATYVTPTSTSTVPATGAGVVSSGSGNNTSTTTPPNTTTNNSSSNTTTNTNTTTNSNNTNTNTNNSNTNTNTNSGNSNTNTNTNTSTGTTTGNSNTTTNTDNQNSSGSQNNQTNTGNQNNQNTSGGQNNQGNTDNNQGNKPADTEEEKVTICHKPPGNTENAKTLIVPRSAVQAHLDHGDALGYCEDSKDNKKTEEKKVEEKKTEEKKNEDKKPDDKKNGKPGGSSLNYSPLLLSADQALMASTTEDAWLKSLLGKSDTTKVYAKVKATYYHYQKTTTSKGIVSFRILDAKTKAVLTAEKMPGQYVWISEWATFNGDERALSAAQLQIAQQRERVPPPPQDLFVEFTKPIYTQITTKIQNFYKGY